MVYNQILTASCIEQLYNEEVHDLLSSDNTKLQIHESKESGVYVAGLREEIVTSPEQVLSLLEEGERFRHFGETKMNKNSSRSHTVFRMVRPKLAATFALWPCKSSPCICYRVLRHYLKLSARILVLVAGIEWTQ